MTKAIAGFDWDDGNREHCQKHGVSLEEIASALLGPLYRFPDPGHSNAETRWRAIGRTAAGRHVFVVYTMRNKAGRIYIRPISARFMHDKEIEYYEKAASSLFRD